LTEIPSPQANPVNPFLIITGVLGTALMHRWNGKDFCNLCKETPANTEINRDFSELFLSILFKLSAI
tara:strand:+ start:14184 stop:14384 length:201 start_codon:yes stop_codon:yes gene_type:complete